MTPTPTTAPYPTKSRSLDFLEWSVLAMVLLRVADDTSCSQFVHGDIDGFYGGGRREPGTLADPRADPPSST